MVEALTKFTRKGDDVPFYEGQPVRFKHAHNTEPVVTAIARIDNARSNFFVFFSRSDRPYAFDEAWRLTALSADGVERALASGKLSLGMETCLGLVCAHRGRHPLLAMGGLAAEVVDLASTLLSPWRRLHRSHRTCAHILDLRWRSDAADVELVEAEAVGHR